MAKQHFDTRSAVTMSESAIVVGLSKAQRTKPEVSTRPYPIDYVSFNNHSSAQAQNADCRHFFGNYVNMNVRHIMIDVAKLISTIHLMNQ